MSENITRGKYRQIRQELKSSQAQADHRTKINKKYERTHPQEPWRVYDSHGPAFDMGFYPVIPENYFRKDINPWFGMISRYLRDKFRGREGDLIGLELGGPGSKLFDSLNTEQGRLFKRSAGATLTDCRKYPGERENDEKNNHKVIEADVLEEGKEKEGKEKILQWLNGEKADFIIERMEGARANLPVDLNYFYLTLKDWYQMLAVGGVMLVQCPKDALQENSRRLYDDINYWVLKLQKESFNEINIQFHRRGLLRIEKLMEDPLPR